MVALVFSYTIHNSYRGKVWMFYTLLKLSEKNNIFLHDKPMYTRTRACVRQHKKERSASLFLCLYLCVLCEGCIFSVFFVLYVNEMEFFLQERPSKERSLLMNE